MPGGLGFLEVAEGAGKFHAHLLQPFDGIGALVKIGLHQVLVHPVVSVLHVHLQRLFHADVIEGSPLDLGVDTQRAHAHVGSAAGGAADRCDYACDPAVPMHQKTWGVNHYIMEDVGPGPDFLKLCFKSPADFGYDTAAIGTEHCQSLVCAIGEGGCPAAMTHVWAPYKDGVLFRSRFWIGYALVDGEYRKILPEGVRVPDVVPQGLFAHNIKEFTNLAAILPSLWQEFGSQPL